MKSTRGSKASIKKKNNSLRILIAGIVLLLAIASSLGWLDWLGVPSLEDAMVRTGLNDRYIDAPLSVHIIDVGQGDSFLVKGPERTALIDAGEVGNGSAVLGYLDAQHVEKIDFLIATHPHSDHIGSMPDVIAAKEIGRVIMAETPDSAMPTTRVWFNLLDAIEDNSLAVEIAAPGAVYDLGDGCTLTVLGPVEPFEDYNDNSLVCRLDFGGISFLFCGDSSAPAENLLVGSEAELSADVLCVAHHGSNSSTTGALLSAVRPRYATISCGLNNSYGHPHSDVLERLSGYVAQVFRTDLEGSVVCTTDGETLEFILIDK